MTANSRTSVAARRGSTPWPHTIEARLHRMEVAELRRLQAVLLGQLHSDSATANDVVQQPQDGLGDDEPTVLMLLAAVAVAIAWWTYRGKPAPAANLRRVFDAVADGQAYLLPIPRSQLCFCGEGRHFKSCHGRPPNAMPLMGTSCTVMRAAG